MKSDTLSIAIILSVKNARAIVLGAEYLSHVKSIETHARVFLTLNILYIGTVKNTIKMNQDF